MKTYKFNDYKDIRDMFLDINPHHSKVCTLFTGAPGSGKTACSASCGLVNMSRAQRKKYRHACEKIDYLNNFNRANLTYPPEEHLVFCSGFKLSNRKMTSYDFDSFRIGLNDRMFKTIYFPMHSLRIIDEIQAIFPSQQDQGMPKIPLRVQLLPGAPDEIIDKVEAGIKQAGAVTRMLEKGMTPEEILTEVCGELGVLFFENEPVCYKCYCSRDRVTAALISIGKEDLTEIMEEGKPFPVECQFCDTVYTFTPEDIAELLKKV